MLELLAQSTAPALPAEHGFSFYALLSGFYGVVEGLTEFLPISSTAHLRIAEDFTGISREAEYWKMFTIVIQLGAILSVPLLFLDRIRKFIHTFPKGENGDKTVW